MAEREAMRRHHPRGLSMLELVIVLAALGAVAALVVPMVTAIQGRPVIENLRANLMALAAAQESHFYDERAYAGDPEALGRTGFAPSSGVRIAIHEAPGRLVRQRFPSRHAGGVLPVRARSRPRGIGARGRGGAL